MQCFYAHYFLTAVLAEYSITHAMLEWKLETWKGVAALCTIWLYNSHFDAMFSMWSCCTGAQHAIKKRDMFSMQWCSNCCEYVKNGDECIHCLSCKNLTCNMMFSFSMWSSMFHNTKLRPHKSVRLNVGKWTTAIKNSPDQILDALGKGFGAHCHPNLCRNTPPCTRGA